MRKVAALTFLLAVLTAVPLFARNKNESYISYDDGGTIIRQGDEGREVDARVNMPVFPGDEVITNRRGRAEVRLADGNVVGIDRATSLRLASVLDSYDNDANDTILELRYGKVALYRTGDATESLRVDTPSASYFAGREATFSVESDSHGKDRLQVFDGNIEVRTPSRTTRVRAGETADVDDRGMYGLVNDNDSADDFERWFLRRAERYNGADSRYLDRSLAYYDDDLAQHGSWTFITGFGWGWRPYVAVGWRPYYYGSWARGRGGYLTWVSYEPWGWAPYHYGRWSYDPMYGWFWLPGVSYSPAWVYWWYGPGYIGWAPSGWYDCYRPYYDWAYRPYRGGVDFGFGFYGRVRVNEVDLRPWTFLDANTIVSNRVDRAALSTDVIRGRLVREPGGYATISGAPARFTRQELTNPGQTVTTIYRRGLASGGGATGSVIPPTDVTAFFRRDADLPGTVRDRIMRTRAVDVGNAVRGGGGTGTPSSVAPIGRGNIAPIGGGNIAPIGSGNVAPTTGGVINRGGDTGWRNTNPSRGTETPASGGDSGRINRGNDTPRDSGRVNRGSDTPRDTGRVNRGNDTPRDDGGRVNRAPETPRSESPRTETPRTPDTPRDNGGRVNRDRSEGTNNPSAQQNWRGRMSRAFPSGTETGDRVDAPSTPAPRAADSNWRNRVVREGEQPAPEAERPRSVDRSSSDVPRRVIDGIGGTRIYRGEGERSGGREAAPRRESSPPPRAPEARPRESSPPPPRQAAPPPRQESHDNGGNRSSGGRIERHKD